MILRVAASRDYEQQTVIHLTESINDVSSYQRI